MYIYHPTTQSKNIMLNLEQNKYKSIKRILIDEFKCEK